MAEVYLKMREQREAGCRSGAHFVHLAAVQMKRILVDHARNRDRLKRGGKRCREGLDWAIASSVDGRRVEAGEQGEAAACMARLGDRQARVVELRCLAGLSVAEAAEALGVSERTVVADWRVARLRLARELKHPFVGSGVP